MLGENIKRIRTERHMTQTALAEKVGVGSQWKPGIPYVKVNGVWKKGYAWAKTPAGWKQGHG